MALYGFLILLPSYRVSWILQGGSLVLSGAIKQKCKRSQQIGLEIKTYVRLYVNLKLLITEKFAVHVTMIKILAFLKSPCAWKLLDKKT